MPDYETLYFTMLDGVEKAIKSLEKVETNCQKQESIIKVIDDLKNLELACEEIYVTTDETVEE